MMPLKIIGMLHNIKTDRYHPILFNLHPLPSGSLSNGGDRYKSAGHHSRGFDTREDAIKYCDIIMQLGGQLEGVRPSLEKDFMWHGEDTPAMVVWFGKDNNKIIPILY